MRWMAPLRRADFGVFFSLSRRVTGSLLDFALRHLFHMLAIAIYDCMTCGRYFACASSGGALGRDILRHGTK